MLQVFWLCVRTYREFISSMKLQIIANGRKTVEHKKLGQSVAEK